MRSPVDPSRKSTNGSTALCAEHGAFAMTSPPRAVFDTNVFLRIILSTKPEGVAPALWQCLEAGRFQLVISELLLAELRNTLLVPELAEIHGWSEDMVSEYVGSVREIATTVAGTVDVDVPDLAERDPSDLALMSAAVEGTADVIVTESVCCRTTLSPGRRKAVW